jgi:hypothetical protein
MNINLKPPLSVIGALTVVTGALQVATPGFVLGQLAVDSNAASLHLFAIIGMFMVLFGGLLLHALSAATPQPTALLWVGFQKLGAAVAVGIGVMNGVFSPLAWLVAGFDLLSGALILAYWRAVKEQQ